MNLTPINETLGASNGARRIFGAKINENGARSSRGIWRETEKRRRARNVGGRSRRQAGEREIVGKERFSDFFPLFERERLLFGALSGKLVASELRAKPVSTAFDASAEAAFRRDFYG